MLMKNDIHATKGLGVFQLNRVGYTVWRKPSIPSTFYYILYLNLIYGMLKVYTAPYTLIFTAYR